MFTIPSWFRSGSLDTMHVATGVDPVLTAQLTPSIREATGTDRTNLIVLLVVIPKERLMVKALEMIVAPVVLSITLTEAVPLSVLRVVSIVKVLETVTITPSKLMVVLKEAV